jgi:hypothetical protein
MIVNESDETQEHDVYEHHAVDDYLVGHVLGFGLSTMIMNIIGDIERDVIWIVNIPV